MEEQNFQMEYQCVGQAELHLVMRVLSLIHYQSSKYN